jgi:hypothetical protein
MNMNMKIKTKMTMDVHMKNIQSGEIILQLGQDS